MFDEIPAVFRRYAIAMYQWADQTENLPNPGAEAAAFIKQTLPIQEWDGSGEPFLYQIRAQTAPVYVAQMIVPTGIAGIAAGQIFNPQLSDVTAPPSTG